MGLDCFARSSMHSCVEAHEDAARMRVLDETRSPSWILNLDLKVCTL